VVTTRAKGHPRPYEIHHWEAGPKAHVVAASGEIDLHAAPALRDTLVHLSELGRTHVVIDMAEATFIDSTAIGVLVGQLRRMRAVGGSLTVVGASDNVRRTFEVAGMDRELEVHGKVPDEVVEEAAKRPHVHPQSKLLRAPGRLEMRLAPEASELSRARGFAAAAGRRFGLDPRQRYDFMLAASEAVANAIEHGRPCHDDTIQMWVTERPDTLTVGVRDAGEFVLEPLPADPLPERGRGLKLMSGLVDAISLRKAGGHTEVELSVRR
jgi:anti-sigma B factor antagonist